jgi:hypothetical protein
MWTVADATATMMDADDALVPGAISLLVAAGVQLRMTANLHGPIGQSRGLVNGEICTCAAVLKGKRPATPEGPGARWLTPDSQAWRASAPSVRKPVCVYACTSGKRASSALCVCPLRHRRKLKAPSKTIAERNPLE